MKSCIVLGRIFFGLLFVVALPNHFKPAAIQMAAAHGVPYASVLVPLAGIIGFIGGLSVILGFKARWGAALLVVFLAPVTLVMHNFWAIHDPGLAQQQMTNFMKNLSLIGGSLIVVFFGAGPVSVDEHLSIPVRRSQPGGTGTGIAAPAH